MIGQIPPNETPSPDGEDAETLSAMLDQAEGLWAQGRLIAARKLEERVVAGRSRVFGREHPDTLKAIGKLAVTMAAQGELAEARLLQEEVVAGMRNLYGDSGRDTLRAINNLAGTVAAQGEIADAGALLEAVIATITRDHGAQDPDGLAAMGNLAGIMWQGGEREEAYELQRRVAELNRRFRGDDDPATLAAAAVLERMERDDLERPLVSRAGEPRWTISAPKGGASSAAANNPDEVRGQQSPVLFRPLVLGVKDVIATGRSDMGGKIISVDAPRHLHKSASHAGGGFEDPVLANLAG